MSTPSAAFLTVSQGIPTAFPTGGGQAGGGGNGNGGGGESSSNPTSLANSASLYLYTFLATLVLLLSVSGAIVVRSFILRRRHRRMVEEAVRNGTYVPPTPPVRAARVDLSKKPELWEAYLGGGGWQLGSFSHGSGKELGMGTNWKFDYSRDWESIKPIYACYTEPLTSVPNAGSTPNVNSLLPRVSMPVPTSTNPSADDEDNRRPAEVSTGTAPSLFSRARTFLNPTSSSADNGTNSRSVSANISLTELSSNSPPPTVRVAVLIAMPSPSSHGSFTPLSASLSSSLSSDAQPATSHPLQTVPSPTLRVTDNEEQPFPLLEMGVADVVVGRSEKSSTWDSAHSKREEKTIYSRGSSYDAEA